MALYKIAIDADSLIYKSISRHSDDKSLELAYAEFWGEIAKIKMQMFKTYSNPNGLVTYQRGDAIFTLILFSPSKTFRNQLSEDYKSNRPPPPPDVVRLKKMVMERVRDMVWIKKGVEADDTIIYFMNKEGYFGAAIDKDVKNASTEFVLDYNKNKWNMPSTITRIEEWYVEQSIMGDSTDGIPGVAGMGEAKARKFIKKHSGRPSYEDWVDLFETEEDAILSMQLVRMDQYNPDTGITLWDSNDWCLDTMENELPDWIEQ